MTTKFPIHKVNDKDEAPKRTNCHWCGKGLRSKTFCDGCDALLCDDCRIKMEDEFFCGGCIGDDNCSSCGEELFKCECCDEKGCMRCGTIHKSCYCNSCYKSLFN